MVLTSLNNEITLTSRHIRIARLLADDGPLGIIKLSRITQLPPPHVRYSLRVLQQKGFLVPTTRGAELNSKGYKFLKELEIEKKRLIDGINRL